MCRSGGCGCRLGCTGTDRIGIFVRVGLIPSMAQEGIVIIIFCVPRSRGGWYHTSGRLGKEERIIFVLGLIGKGLD